MKSKEEALLEMKVSEELYQFAGSMRRLQKLMTDGDFQAVCEARAKDIIKIVRGEEVKR